MSYRPYNGIIGVLYNATSLGSFDGSVIQDNTTVKQALQDIEDLLEIAATIPYVNSKIEDSIANGETEVRRRHTEVPVR
jgi:hypothetical protein